MSSLRDRLPTRARRRRPAHRYRFSVWTFVAPVALVVAVIVAVSVIQPALESRRSSTRPATTTGAAPTTTAPVSQPGTTTGPTKRKRYLVKDGDTLDGIATTLGIDIQTLLELNPKIDPLNLRPGQKIRVA